MLSIYKYESFRKSVTKTYLTNTLSVYMYSRQLKQTNNTNHKKSLYSHNRFTIKNRLRTNQLLFQFWNNMSVKYWVGGCCLTLNEHILSYIMVITSCIRWNHCVFFVLEQPAQFNFYSVRSLLKQQSTVDTAFHSDTLSWFRANQFLFLFLNAAFFRESSKY